MLGLLISLVDHSVVGNGVVSNGVVGSMVDHGGSMVHSVVCNRGMVDSMVGNRSSVVDCVVGDRGSMMDSMVGHRCGVNCVVDRGSGKRAAGKCCEGNLGISLGLGGSQDSGEEGSNGKCLKFFCNLFYVVIFR